MEKFELSDEEWQERLTPEQYRILRQAGTERAFTGKYHDHKREGHYACAGCGVPLFSSEHKYDSGSGWPSFWRELEAENLHLRDDFSLYAQRTEVLCARCGGHLGHVFDDGPPPTRKRYCMNSGALDFRPKEEP